MPKNVADTAGHQHKEPDTTGDWMSNKPMRELMPETTALVDALRARGLTDNATLAQGLKDGTFWAQESGHSIGGRGEQLVAVRPVLPLHMEVKHLDREWKERNGR